MPILPRSTGPIATVACVELHVSLVGRTHLTDEIYRQVRTAIVDGVVRPGERLPASREMARSLEVSRNTVVVAYDRLVGEGLATARTGSGVYVSDELPDRSPSRRTAGVMRPRPIWTEIRSPTLPPDRRFNFRTGIGDASLFPHAAWRRLVASAMRTEAGRSGSYADPAGLPSLRRAIAGQLGRSRGVQTTAEDLVVTSGTQQALDLCARALLAPGDRVAIENPGYPPAVKLFRSLGLEVVGVPVDLDGIVADEIPPRTKLVYVTPSHQYPLGMAMTLRRRLDLLAWAEENDAAIIEDDYDSEVRISGRPIDPLQTLDGHGRVIYVGSFSKTMLPSLRIGYAVVPPSVIEAVTAAKFLADWHSPVVTQLALARFIADGQFASHLRKVRPIYRARHALIEQAITIDFAGDLELIPTATGLHIGAWADEGDRQRFDGLVGRAAEAGVTVQAAHTFAVDRPVRPGVVIGYGGIRTEDIAEGLRCLRACL